MDLLLEGRRFGCRHLVIRHTENRRLFFAVGADLLQRIRVGPDARTTTTLMELNLANDNSIHGHAAARAKFGVTADNLRGLGFCAAVRAELLSKKHHSKARRAGDRGQAGAAMIAGGCQ